MTDLFKIVMSFLPFEKTLVSILVMTVSFELEIAAVVPPSQWCGWVCHWEVLVKPWQFVYFELEQHIENNNLTGFKTY